ncbi:HD-GYP domain-containing protein [Sphingomonas sp. 8AM]|uniref:HD-GYP domain-containing protein n=1 Tax=Sphingomonas sp. 8AM TaxID=2653170 RepID=UPI0012F00ED8|nr:HD-GYP domain-containing protein [Sphingomonas sp. 8AM]VXC42043.1 putative enzyme [Sphingomonas sp. 8AM]
MLVTIKTEDARLGMFVHAVKGGWMASPFWRRHFMLDTAADLKKLRESGVVGLVIDLSRGIGPAAAPPAPGSVLAGPDDAAPDAGLAALDEPHLPSRRRRGAISPEQRAQAVVDASKVIVQAMFDEVRLGRAVDVQALTPVAEQIVESVTRDAAAMLNVTRLKSKDEYTYVHSIAVAALLIHFAQTLKLPDADVSALGLAGLLHDIGKMGVPKALLDKPGKLEPPEMAVLRHHPEKGYALLSAGRALPPVVLDVCLHHHERYDGRGYPEGLRGDQLSLAARMSSICDVYDAVTSQRPYKRPWSPSEALSRMRSWSGHFDAELLDRFIESIGIHPVGGLVRLQSSRLAIVIEGNDREPTQPIVRVFYDIPAQRFIPAHDLAATIADDPIHRAECGQRWFGDRWTTLESEILGERPAPSAAAMSKGVLS